MRIHICNNACVYANLYKKFVIPAIVLRYITLELFKKCLYISY